MDQPQLGQLIENGERRRDAIHIAVAPVTATVRLQPGDHVGLIEQGNKELVGPCEQTIGIVDPFLHVAVEPGERFWLFLYPNTVTGMRHVWSHPAFTAVVPVRISSPYYPPTRSGASETFTSQHSREANRAEGP